MSGEREREREGGRWRTALGRFWAARRTLRVRPGGARVNKCGGGRGGAGRAGIPALGRLIWMRIRSPGGGALRPAARAGAGWRAGGSGRGKGAEEGEEEGGRRREEGEDAGGGAARRAAARGARAARLISRRPPSARSAAAGVRWGWPGLAPRGDAEFEKCGAPYADLTLPTSPKLSSERRRSRLSPGHLAAARGPRARTPGARVLTAGPGRWGPGRGRRGDWWAAGRDRAEMQTCSGKGIKMAFLDVQSSSTPSLPPPPLRPAGREVGEELATPAPRPPSRPPPRPPRPACLPARSRPRSPLTLISRHITCCSCASPGDVLLERRRRRCGGGVAGGGVGETRALPQPPAPILAGGCSLHPRDGGDAAVPHPTPTAAPGWPPRPPRAPPGTQGEEDWAAPTPGKGSGGAPRLGWGGGHCGIPPQPPAPDFSGLTAVSIPGMAGHCRPPPHSTAAPGCPHALRGAPPGGPAGEGLGPPPSPGEGSRRRRPSAMRPARRSLPAVHLHGPPHAPFPSPAPHCGRLPAPGSPSLHSVVCFLLF